MHESIDLDLTDQMANDNRHERRDAAENRDRILRAARRLFAEQGVAAVNMSDIALAAEVGKGTLYRRFANKGELCYALMDEQLAEFQNSQIAQMQQMLANGAPFLEQLSDFLVALVSFTEDHVPLLCEVMQIAPDARTFELPHFWQYMTVHGLLESAAGAGELPTDLDIVFLADTLLAPLSADFYRFMRQVRGYPAERISLGLRELVLRLGSLED